MRRRRVYSGDWFTLNLDRVRFPGGRIVEKFHFLDFHKESVAALVEDRRGRLLFVRAYRYPTNSVEWEIPAGVIDPGESIVAAARREVREETGYETAGHRRVYSFFPINGISNKLFHVVRCRALRGTERFDRSEVKERRWFARKEILAMLKKETIRDGFTLAAVLFHSRPPGKRDCA
jgi:ADP-ribose pyrophosphatase